MGKCTGKESGETGSYQRSRASFKGRTLAVNFSLFCVVRDRVGRMSFPWERDLKYAATKRTDNARSKMTAAICTKVDARK